jgi:hypothetical protein
LQTFSHALPQRLGGHEKVKLSVVNVLVVVVKISADERRNNIINGVGIVDRPAINVVAVEFDAFNIP